MTNVPLLRQQLINKRAHGRKNKLQSLNRKRIIAEPFRDKEIDKLFEHNKTVAPESFHLPAAGDSSPEKQYNEEDVSHFKSKFVDDFILVLTCAVHECRRRDVVNLQG